MTTPRLGAPELVVAQDVPETTVNEQIRFCEQGANHFIVKDKDLATPPGSPSDGDAYIVASSPTGAWSGWAGRIAFYKSGWDDIIPIEGSQAYVQDENIVYEYNGTAWSSPSGSYSDEQAQDAVGGILVDSSTIDFTYNDATPSITAAVINDSITYAKMQNVSATSRILGRKTSGAGDPEECTLSEILDFIGSAAQGDILYRGASAWARLGPGTSGHFLQTQGAAANPQWAAAAGGYSGGVQSTPILAAAMTARTTSGAAAGTAETSTNKIMLATLDFDQSTDEFAQFMFPMPKSWNESTVTAQFIWTATTTGNVVWGIQGVAISDDDVLDAAFGTAETVTDGVTAANDLMQSAFTSAVTIGGTPAEGDLVCFQVYRDADNGSDTLAADAKLIGIRLNFTTNASDDS